MIIISSQTKTETPRNHAAPKINPEIQKRLTAIGGIVPEGGGPYAGQPVYRLAFGQQEKHFSRGRLRVRFPDPDIEEIITQERFFVAPEVFIRVAEWQKMREKNRLERFLNCDYSVFADFEPVSSYLEQHESSLDYQKLPESVGTREEVEGGYESIAQISAPQGWLYLCDVKGIEEIGKNCWFVMRWISASAHGGREAWEKYRYTTDAYIPELNCVVPLVDDLGEFPEYGFYIPRFEIAEYHRDDHGEYTAESFSYLEPNNQNAVEPVIEEIYRQAKMTNQDKNRNWRTKQNEERLIEKRDAQEKEMFASIASRLEL